MNSYHLTKQWFSFSCGNTAVNTHHTALYLWLVEQNNQQQWRETFGFAFEEIGCYVHISYKTFKKTLDNLVEWGFLRVIGKPINQHSNWHVALGATPEAGEVASVCTPEAPAVASGNGSGAFPGAGSFASGNLTTPFIINNKTFLLKNNTNGSGVHTHARTRGENPGKKMKFSFSVSQPEEEKKKSCGKKRKETFTVREAAFKEAVFAFSKLYSFQDLQAFYDYWSEPDEQESMRWELERTWELSRRLKQWMKRETQIKHRNNYGQTTKLQATASGYAAENLDYRIPL